MEPEPYYDEDVAEEGAPQYQIPTRGITALEHPLIIKDLDKGLKTFGRKPDFDAVLAPSGPQSAVPLYLRYQDPVNSAIVSHNAACHNILFKVTVPKRTGRKRKRGSEGPWESAPEPESNDPSVLRRTMQDNIGNYEVEAIGKIKHTHRYRGLADFQHSISDSPFMKTFVEQVVPAELSKLRDFRLRSDHYKPLEVVPAPTMTNLAIPYPYSYSQNAAVREVTADDGTVEVLNTMSRQVTAGYIIKYNQHPVPTEPRWQPKMSDPQVARVVTELRLAMEDRPIWTRRSLINRLSAIDNALALSANLIKKCISFTGYQFKGGPWRDAVVRYGVDPRSDPKYRVYQTLLFKLDRLNVGSLGQTWHAVRSANQVRIKAAPADNTQTDSHIFDGTAYSDDGKVWQVCDIHDPLLRRLFDRAEVRRACDEHTSGWYRHGLWSKARAIMKSKMTALRFGRDVTNADYARAMAVPDASPPSHATRTISVPVPDLRLTPLEEAQLSTRTYQHPAKGPKRRRKKPTSFPARNWAPEAPGPGPPADDGADSDEASPGEQLHAEMGSAAPSSDDAGDSSGSGLDDSDLDDEDVQDVVEAAAGESDVESESTSDEGEDEADADEDEDEEQDDGEGDDAYEDLDPRYRNSYQGPSGRRRSPVVNIYGDLIGQEEFAGGYDDNDGEDY